MVSLCQRLHGLVQLRGALRSLRRRPAFVAATVVTFTLGTTATTTVFSVVDTVLLKPLPFPDPGQLVTVLEASSLDLARTSLIAPARLVDWNRLNRSFTLISGWYGESLTDTSGTDPERLAGRRVAPGFFTVYGRDPIIGRTFSPDEEQATGPGAAVLSETFWKRRYQSDSAAIGRALIIGDRPFTIVGVMPASFATGAVDVWLPAQLGPGLLRARAARFLNGIGRLKPGVSVEQGRDDLHRVQQELAAQFPTTDKGWSAAVADLKGSRIDEHRRRLWLAFGAVTLLWVIAITNVSALVLVETHRRAREMAVRTALGASRSRIASVVLHDVVILAMTGAVLGAVISGWLVGYVRTTFVTLPRMVELTLDWRALAFAAVSSALAALACGLFPAFASTRRPVMQWLSLGGRGASTATHRLQRALVVAQVSLTVLLCVSAALLARSYQNLSQVELGFSADGVVSFRVAARWDEDRARVGQLQEAILSGLDARPEVESVGMTSFLPLSGQSFRQHVEVIGLKTDSLELLSAGQRSVSDGYLRTLGVPLLAGEWCPPFNRTTPEQPTAVINERFAARFPAGAAIVGHQFRFIDGVTTAKGAPVTYRIAGIVGNMAEDGPGVDVAPYVYMCAGPGGWPDPEYVVRTTNTAAFTSGLRALIRQIDPARAVFGVRLLPDLLATAIDQPRISTELVSIFAAAAMLLAATGLYGLFTLIVGETRREMGVRLALGAAPRQLMQLVFAGAGRLLLIGVLAGLALTVGAGRWLRGLLFGVSPLDPAALVTATLTLLLVSALAIAIPAWRAARTTPSEALAGE